MADKAGKTADIYGVTLFGPSTGPLGDRPPHPDDNYAKNIRDLHAAFDLEMPVMIVGDSTCNPVHDLIDLIPPFDAIFVDASHEYAMVSNDLLFYTKHIKPGGYLICDDAANGLKQPFGFFQGIEDVTKAVNTVILTDSQWEHKITVCHDRLFQKVNND